MCRFLCPRCFSSRKFTPTTPFCCTELSTTTKTKKSPLTFYEPLQGPAHTCTTMTPGPTVTCCVVLVLLTSLAHLIQCCFPVDDVFFRHTDWIQTTSMESRVSIEVGKEADDIIVIRKKEQGKPKEWILRCLTEFGGNRYLVKIEEDYNNARFLCYKFTSLDQRVVRQSYTEENFNRKRVDCINDPYKEDQAVLVAATDIHPVHCPLSGGFQLVLNQGMAVDDKCLQSVRKYNPRLQFQCDGQRSGNAVIDFGQACRPALLNKVMGSRQLTHLRCVSEWKESAYSSLLLQMRDHPDVYWCLHYKSTRGTADMFTVLLALDGHCSTQVFGDEDVPRNTSMFGYLIAYKPESDLRCREKVYVESCNLDPDKCLGSTECPSYCGRCQKTLTHLNCSFPVDTQASWKVVNSGRQLDIIVERSKIMISDLGDFMCYGPPEPGQHYSTYPVVQISTGPTCMPYYACALVFSPTPGLLTFQLQPSFRNQETGEPLSCKKSQELMGQDPPAEPEEAITLINLGKLNKTPCKHRVSSTYPTIFPGCRLVVPECSGTCETLNVTFDAPACVNTTDLEIDATHTCYATITFNDDVQGILAKTSVSGRFLCWLFGSTRLFITEPEECNQKSINQIFSDTKAQTLYDPVKLISLPSVIEKNKGASFQVHHLVLLCGIFFVHVCRQYK